MPPALSAPRPAAFRSAAPSPFPQPVARRSDAAPTVALLRAAHPDPNLNLNQASICSSMAIPGSVPLLKGAAALTGTAVALPFGSF